MRIFARSRWQWDAVPTIAQAHSWIARRGAPSVIICERDLPDGSWKHLFDEIQALPLPPKFIVSSRLADEYLWVEVLNLGGHNVLSTPFDAREVSYVVRYAAESWHRERECAPQRQTGAGAEGLPDAPSLLKSRRSAARLQSDRKITISPRKGEV
jgi:DNA-binding NtrC family response regulator